MSNSNYTIDNLVDNLNYINETKGLIKNAIISKGQTINANDPFRVYANKITNIQTGSSTSDANATVSDLVMNKTAYVNGQKITGIVPERNSNTFTVFEDNVSVSVNNIVNTMLMTGHINRDILVRDGAAASIEVPYSNITSEINLTSNKIVSGNTVLGIPGTAIELVGENREFYPAVTSQTYTPSTGKTGMTEVTILPVTSNIDANITPNNIKAGAQILGVEGLSSVVDTSDANATADNILNGFSAYVNGNKIDGNVTNLGELNYTPTTSIQNIPAGYTTGGNIQPVTSNIDVNIVPNNIKSGVNVLGISGNFEGDFSNTLTPAEYNSALKVSNMILDYANNYTRVAYLEGTGTQHIILDVPPVLNLNISNDFYSFEMNAQFVTGPDYTNDYMWSLSGISAYIGASSSAFLYVGIHQNSESSTWCFSDGRVSATDYITNIPSDFNQHTFKVVSSRNSDIKGLYIDGERVDNRGPAAPSTLSSNTVRYCYPFMLFAYERKKRDEEKEVVHSNCKIYSFSICANADFNTPLINLIPVRYGNIPGMYDLVAHKFYRNRGTGEFLVGPDIND